MFSVLEDTEASWDMLNDDGDMMENLFLVGKKNIFRTTRRMIGKQIVGLQPVKKKTMKKKTNILTLFEVRNRYSLLEDNPEIEIDSLIRRNVILKTSKQKLKKCSCCNFKKRSCLLDPQHCKALQSYCFKCKKKGHFPASIKCKMTKRYPFDQVTISIYLIHISFTVI